MLDHLVPIHTGIEIPNPMCLFVAFNAIKQFVKGCRLKSAASVATDAVCVNHQGTSDAKVSR